MDLDRILRERRSVKSYDEDFAVDDDLLRRLFRKVARTPSSYNLQHWRFVVVRDAARRAELQAASYGQPHVGAAPAVIVVGAKLNAHEDAARANAHAPDEVLATLVPLIEKSYGAHPQFQRDEAVRSASLAAMTLMLAAHEEGLATCPMIGFDPARVSALAGFDETHIPVMLVCLGRPGPGTPFPTSRYPLSDTVKLETLDGPGLTGS